MAALLLAGCGSSSPQAPVEATPQRASVAPEDPPPAWPSWGGIPWPHRDDVTLQGLVRAELDRDPAAEAIEHAWRHADPALRARAAWTLARIGSPSARDRMSAWLADGRVELDAPTLAAFALLPAPAAEDGPPEAAWDELEDRLWTRYAVTEEPAEADALLLAIARTGGARSQARLAADLAVLPSAEDEPRYAHGMEAAAILCGRGHALTSDGLRAIGQGLEGGAVARRPAAYALGRCAAVSAELLAGPERGVLVERLAALVEGDDPEASRRAWAALEGLGELPRVVPGGVLGTDPGTAATDWMTEVAAARALTAHADGRKVLARRLKAVEVQRLEGPRLHALREGLERLRPFAANEDGLEAALEPLLASVEAARASETAPGRGKALALVGCEAQLLLATRSGSLEALERCASGVTTVPPEHGARLAIEALVHMGGVLPREQRVSALLEWARDPRASVAAAALSALAGLEHPGIAEALREALGHDDMGVVAAAAGAVGRRAADQSRRDPLAVTPLLAVIERFDDEHAVETRIAAIEALGRLARSGASSTNDGGEGTAQAGEGETAPGEGASAAAGDPPPWLETKIVPLSRDPSAAVRHAARRALRGHRRLLEAFDAGMPPSFPDGFSPAVHEAVTAWGSRAAALRLHTDAGAITIDLTGAPAPIAQANLAALAERGFFDGLTFHRVVPGFVIQGGDPRGDGYGGPGHVMPCEWSNLRYERGTVGIALAGKDTGGSQIFIAHDQPRHLDARYTVIGTVVGGMEVVDAIWPYDRITRVEVLERPSAAVDAVREGERSP